jgi:hypothetical protein
LQLQQEYARTGLIKPIELHLEVGEMLALAGEQTATPREHTGSILFEAA